jgi:hypothetical protein
MAMDVEAGIRDLKRRVGELEGSFGFLTRQVQNVHRDLLSFEEKTEGKLREHDSRFDRVDGKIDALDRKVDALDRKIDAKVDGLASALPGIIIDALREDRERDRKR